MTTGAVPAAPDSERPDFLSIDDLAPGTLDHILQLSVKVKASPGDFSGALEGRSAALIFEKPSTRTRVSFEVAVAGMGGHPLTLSTRDLQLGRGETIEDTGRVLSRYVDAIVLRTFEQERLEILARAASIPVVNALSDREHPCQVLADLLTIREHKGELARLSLAYIGDGNNVAHSLLLGGAKAGMRVRVATPPGHEPDPGVVHRATRIAGETGGGIEVSRDPLRAATGSDVLYTDVWVSMGQEEEHGDRVAVFEPFRLDREKVDRAAPDAIVMHCLPAHRGEEITDEVIDGPRSVVWDQAENRLHTQKALLLWIFGLD